MIEWHVGLWSLLIISVVLKSWLLIACSDSPDFLVKELLYWNLLLPAALHCLTWVLGLWSSSHRNSLKECNLILLFTVVSILTHICSFNVLFQTYSLFVFSPWALVFWSLELCKSAILYYSLLLHLSVLVSVPSMCYFKLILFLCLVLGLWSSGHWNSL